MLRSDMKSTPLRPDSFELCLEAQSVSRDDANKRQLAALFKSPSAHNFHSAIRRFESSRPSHAVQPFGRSPVSWKTTRSSVGFRRLLARGDGKWALFSPIGALTGPESPVPFFESPEFLLARRARAWCRGPQLLIRSLPSPAPIWSKAPALTTRLVVKSRAATLRSAWSPEGYGFVDCNWKKRKAKFANSQGHLRFVDF
jgi:hypothetical protein